MKPKKTIQLLSEAYRFGINALYNHNKGIKRRPQKDIEAYKKITTRIEECIYLLDSESRFIIENEIIIGRNGTWYTEYLSTATYYRHANKAYKTYLRLLNK